MIVYTEPKLLKILPWLEIYVKIKDKEYGIFVCDKLSCRSGVG